MRAAALLPGLGACIAIAAVATVFGRLAPVIGAPVFAIVAGIGATAIWPPPARVRPGIAFASRRVLQASIVVLGLGLSAREVLSIGRSSLPVLVTTIVLVLAVAALLGPRLGLRSDTTTLIGVGTAICGASAIAATSAVITAAEADVAYAIATIFTFNVAAVLLYPTLGHALGLSQHAFGAWAGTAINDTSSVVAASTIYGHTATSYGVAVKLTRTLAIVPICLGIAAWRRRQTPVRPTGAVGLLQIFPVFVIGFIAAVAINSAGLVPGPAHHGLSELARFMITTALAAIGLSTSVREIRAAGPRPIILGGVLWATIGIAGLALQAATGGP